jgi:hypothetical protein
MKKDDSISEPKRKNRAQVKYAFCVSIRIFLKSFVTLDYGFCNNLLAGQSFNENLLYLSPVIKKIYYY